jgi:hypothetical protein
LLLVSVLVTGRPEGCGRERQAIKTLADAEALEVALEPKVATVEELVSLAPPPYREAASRDAVEKKTYAVVGRVIAFKEESGDGDFHVVIAGDSGATLVAELPKPECARAQGFAERISTARQRFVEQFGQPIRGVFRLLRRAPRVKVVGVGFFDRVHGQRGGAPNGIELHPVLSIERLTESSRDSTRPVPPPRERVDLP